MDKSTIVATIKRQQAELAEMITSIRKDRRMGKIVSALEKRYRITDRLLEARSEEHTSELQSHSFISYAVFCLKKKTRTISLAIM